MSSSPEEFSHTVEFALSVLTTLNDLPHVTV